MSRAPDLSILMPTYNYADFIDEALQSLSKCAAELAPGLVEILVVDDGSTDQTPEVLARWIDVDGVRIIRRENGGVAAARNTAMEHARGNLFMFVDADDVLLPGCVRCTIDFLERHPDVGMFFTNYDLFDSEGVVNPSGVDTWKVFRQLPHEEVESNDGDRDGWVFRDSLAAAILEHGSFMHTSGLTVRRSVAERVGAFREGFTYGEDDDYWARCAQRCRTGYVDRLLSRKRNHERSIIHDSSRGLANIRSLLTLTEIQLTEFRDDPLPAILERKALRCAESLIWGLLEAGRRDEAAAILQKYLRKHRWRWQLYKLAAKAFLRARSR